MLCLEDLFAVRLSYAPTDTVLLLVVDAAPLLPSFLQPDISGQLRAYYVSTYNDKFFEQPAPTWFVVFITMEIFYHAPLSLWAIGALLRGTTQPTTRMMKTEALT